MQRVFSTFLPQVVRMYFVSAPLFPRNCFIFIDKEARQTFSTKFDRLLVGFWQQWLRWWRGVSFISVGNETWRNIYRGKLRTVLGSGTCFYDNFGISLWQPEALYLLPTFLDKRARWRQFSIQLELKVFFGNRLCIVKLLSFFLSRQENAHGGNNNERF